MAQSGLRRVSLHLQNPSVFLVRTRYTTPVPEERSRIMRSIRSSGNASTELRLRSILLAGRMTGWRRHLKLPGRPDFAWPATKVAVFVDGCFWHRCPTCFKPPKTNSAFWQAKVDKNARRDRTVARQLRADGWSVLRVWEHSLRDPDRVAMRVRRALARAAARGTERTWR
jgi:DNA mismatch endonuclease, patch repair protein